ncbi:MAG TPA: hypothetical protein PLO89_05065 [Spirochaetota bacterium]|mgnify:CR=1 FL=1|nr:hypothetical protein [Spirochaetota bacterium]
MNKVLPRIIGYILVLSAVSFFVFFMLYSFSSLEDKKSTVSSPDEPYILNQLAEEYEKILLKKRMELEEQRKSLMRKDVSSLSLSEKLEIERKLSEIADERKLIGKQIDNFNVEKKKFEADIKDLKEAVRIRDKDIANLKLMNYNLSLESEKNGKSLSEYVNFLRYSLENVYKNDPEKLKGIGMEFSRDNGKSFLINEIKSLNSQVGELYALIEKYKTEKGGESIVNFETEKKLKDLEAKIEKYRISNEAVLSYLSTKNQKNIDNLDHSDFFIGVYSKLYEDIAKKSSSLAELEEKYSKLSKREKDREIKDKKIVDLLSENKEYPQAGEGAADFFYNAFERLYLKISQNKGVDDSVLIAEKEAEIKRLEEKLDALIKEKNQLLLDLSLLKDKITTLSAEISDKDKKINDLISSSAKKEEMFALNSQIDELKKEKDVLGKELEVLKADIKKLSDESLEKDKLIAELKEQNEKSKEDKVVAEDLELLKKEKEEIYAELLSLKEKIKNFEDENKKITDYLETKDEKITVGDMIGEFVINTFKKLFEIIGKKEEEIAVLKAEFGKNNDALLQSKISDFDKISKEKEDLTRQLFLLKERIENLESANKSITDYLSEKKESIEDEANPGKSFLNIFGRLFSEADRNKTEITKLNDAVALFKKDFEKYKENVEKRETLFVKERETLFGITNANGLFSSDSKGRIYAVVNKEKEAEILKKEIFLVYNKNKEVISKIQIKKKDSSFVIVKFPGYNAPTAGSWF